MFVHFRQASQELPQVTQVTSDRCKFTILPIVKVAAAAEDLCVKTARPAIWRLQVMAGRTSQLLCASPSVSTNQIGAEKGSRPQEL